MMGQPTIATLTQHYQPGDLLDSFATTNALLWLTAKQQQPIVHYWQQSPTVILGLLDQQLPALADGIHFLTQSGYQVMLRNSGGLAVVADAGVLNVSLFLPADRQAYTINAAYDLMTQAVQSVWPALPIVAGEIKHSYCPGDYDLSIHGQKIAGMSQRRTAKALVIMLYISINGDQAQRSQLIQDFYTRSLAGQIDDRFPQVDPTVMTTVAAQLDQTITPQQAITQFNQHLATHGSLDTEWLPLVTTEPEFQAHLTQAFQEIARRQQRLPER